LTVSSTNLSQTAPASTVTEFPLKDIFLPPYLITTPLKSLSLTNMSLPPPMTKMGNLFFLAKETVTVLAGDGFIFCNLLIKRGFVCPCWWR